MNPACVSASDPVSVFMLKKIRGTRCNLIRNTKVIKELTKCYPDKSIELCNHGRHQVTYRTIGKLVSRRYLQKIDGVRPSQYRLSTYGRCAVLCVKLDVSMLELCVMTEAYATHRYQIKCGCQHSYVLHGLVELFGGVYPKVTIQRASRKLCAKGFADSIRDMTIRLRPDTMKKLKEFDCVLSELHEWIVGIPHILDTISFYDKSLVDDIKR